MKSIIKRYDFTILLAQAAVGYPLIVGAPLIADATRLRIDVNFEENTLDLVPLMEDASAKKEDPLFMREHEELVAYSDGTFEVIDPSTLIDLGGDIEALLPASMHV
jgi:hypothetical protein